MMYVHINVERKSNGDCLLFFFFKNSLPFSSFFRVIEDIQKYVFQKLIYIYIRMKSLFKFEKAIDRLVCINYIDSRILVNIFTVFRYSHQSNCLRHDKHTVLFSYNYERHIYTRATQWYRISIWSYACVSFPQPIYFKTKLCRKIISPHPSMHWKK